MRNVVFALAAAIGLVFASPAPSSAQLKKDTSNLTPHAIDVRARRIENFSRRKESDTATANRLVWRGGLVLTSPSPYFGGWSGLRLDPDGKRFVAISDAGLWMTGEIAYDEKSTRPKALEKTRIGPLLALDGKPLRRLRDRDAEALALASGTLSKGTAYIAFEQVLAGALEEVERGLTRIAGQQRRHAALSRTREHRERAHRLAQRSYELGEVNLSDVLDAQRGALQARQKALEGRTALATAQVALYVALGGGWNAGGAEAAEAPSEVSAAQSAAAPPP